jgi:uncharacterized MAPEG superfamily protein
MMLVSVIMGASGFFSDSIDGIACSFLLVHIIYAAIYVFLTDYLIR